MPRLPGNLPRGTLAAQAAHHGRAFTDAIRRDKAAELKMFAANLRAARAGPPPKKYTPPPEPKDAVTRYHMSELRRILKADTGKVLTPQRAQQIENWHEREIAKILKAGFRGR